MMWKHRFFASFITGFGVTSGLVSALGISSVIVKYFYVNNSITDSQPNKQETESLDESEQPYQSEITDNCDNQLDSDSARVIEHGTKINQSEVSA